MDLFSGSATAAGRTVLAWIDLIPLPHDGSKRVLSLVSKLVRLLRQSHSRDRIAIERFGRGQKLFRGLY